MTSFPLFFFFLPFYQVIGFMGKIRSSNFKKTFTNAVLSRKNKKELAGLQKEQRKLKSDAEVRIFDIISTFLFFTFLPGYRIEFKQETVISIDKG